MIYLLAKYTLIFLLTGLLGFWLGHWWSRRNFVDVSESYESLTRSRENDKASWDRLWQRFDALPEPPSLDGVYARMETVDKAIAALPEPPTVDLSGIEGRLATLEQAIGNLPEPKPVDLGPVKRQVEALDARISALPAPEPVNFASVNERLDAVDKALGAIPRPPALDPLLSRIADVEAKVDGIRIPEAPSLAGLESRLVDLDKRLSGIPRPEAVDLEPIDQRLRQIEARLAAIRIPEPEAVDLAPLDQRMDGIEIQLRGLRERMIATATPKPVPPPRRDEPKLLSAALYGKKDDLKLISGVGPKLERLLNENGVYYFWQVASWTRRDVDFVDDRLEVFKGRISRDDWVRQAKKLKSRPEAAQPPAE